MKTLKTLTWFMILGALLHSPCPMLQAQNCDDNLESATRAYYNGQLTEVEGLLAECLNKGLSKEQRVSGYRLMILSYLFQGKSNEAEEMMLALLKTRPEFKPSKADPVELVKLYQSFRTDPVFSIGVLGGINTGSYVVENQHSVGSEFNPAEYNGKAGFQFGATAAYHFNPSMGLVTGIFV